MGRQVVRVLGWGPGFFALEGLMVAVLVGMYCHKSGWHGALVATASIASFALFLFLIAKVAIFFWIWTAFVILGVCLDAFKGIEDKGWAIFWGVVISAVILWLHLISRASLQGRAVKETVVIDD